MVAQVARRVQDGRDNWSVTVIVIAVLLDDELLAGGDSLIDRLEGLSLGNALQNGRQRHSARGRVRSFGRDGVHGWGGQWRG